jgi:signal transduction histidine kinase/DNA-binding response OmpR family regulator
MVVVSDVMNGFSDEQERVLSQLGDVTSTAIDNRYLIRRQNETVYEVQRLYEATNSLSQSRDIAQVTAVLQQSMATFRSDYTAGYLDANTGLPEEDLRLFNFTAEGLEPVDFEPLFAGYELPKDGLYIDDLTRAEKSNKLYKQLMEQGVRSFAAIDLHPRDIPGGLLVVAYREIHVFSEAERRYFNTLSDSASIIFNNIILFDQIQSTLEETSILYQASRALSDAMTPPDILDVVVNYLILPQVNQTFIALLTSDRWDVEGASVNIAASWNQDEAMDLLGVTLTSEQFPAWRQLSSPTVVTINDVQTDENLDPIEQIGIESLESRSVTVIPLRTSNRIIGAVWISSNEPHEHSERELRTYQSFAESASLSMEASYLLQQTERRARQLEASAQVSQTAGQILDLEVLLPQVVDLIKQTFAYDHAQIFLMDEMDDYAMLRASTGEAGRQLLEIQHKLAKGSDSVIGQVTSIGQPTIALDTADANVVHKPNPYLPLTRSEMALPLIIQDRVVGALDVQSNQPNAFNDEDIRALTTLAAQISVAIDNANLYQSAQEQADKMGFLFEVTSAATAAESLEEALNIVAARLHQMLGALSVTLYLPTVYIDDNDNTYTTLRAVALAGSDQPLSEIEEVRLDDSERLISEISRNKKAFVIDNVGAEVRYLPIVSSAKSAVMLPMVSANELIGLIVLEDSRPNAYEYDILQLLLTMTGSLSAVTQSLQLLEQLTATNEQLRELDRLKSDFLANMSHELRTPMNSIIGFSRVMLKGIDGPLTEMQEQDLTTIYNSGQHLLTLINDILDQAKIASGKLDLKYAHFEIKPVIEAVKSIAVGLVKDKDVSLLSQISPNLPRVYGDEVRTRQILLNLVSNAAKFTPEGHIAIRVYPVEDPKHGLMVRIDVEDTGIGIADKDLPLLFEAFQQIDSSLTLTQGGTGLGLPIAKSLVEMQGGEMIVNSEIGVGSVFSLTIPVEPHKIEQNDDEDFEQEDELEATLNPKTKPTMQIALSPALGQASPARLMQAKREILLIEDNKDMVDQFRRLLQREGFEVQTADHPAYAEAMVSNLQPTLVVMDINFAGGEGWNILQRLKDRDDTFDIPVIVVTLNGDSEKAYQLGAHIFIQRPFAQDDLVEAALNAEKDSNTQRILIIDDEPESVRLLTEALNANGTYRVFSAHTGLEGISLTARRRPDLILLDLRMPEMDGFAVLQELRANPETASIPVMVVTSEADLKAEELQKLSNVHVLYKADINEEQAESFIRGIKQHLELNGRN